MIRVTLFPLVFARHPLCSGGLCSCVRWVSLFPPGSAASLRWCWQQLCSGRSCYTWNHRTGHLLEISDIESQVDARTWEDWQQNTGEQVRVCVFVCLFVYLMLHCNNNCVRCGSVLVYLVDLLGSVWTCSCIIPHHRQGQFMMQWSLINDLFFLVCFSKTLKSTKARVVWFRVRFM